MKVCLLELPSDDNPSTADETREKCLVRTAGPSKKVILYGRRRFGTKILPFRASGTMPEASSATTLEAITERSGPSTEKYAALCWAAARPPVRFRLEASRRGPRGAFRSRRDRRRGPGADLPCWDE